MTIFNHFQNLKLTNDQNQVLEKLSVFLENDSHIFILKGFAGSGKTTLLNGVIKHLISKKIVPQVMAPTGRAAKILKEKTGFGQTIHRGIYNFQDLKVTKNKDNPEDKNLHYLFPLTTLEGDGKVIIVDESSMISSKDSISELYTFGTDNILNDLLTFSKVPYSKNKIIFVGDPAQLPPVHDSNSMALDIKYFNDLNLKASEYTLTEVVRQSKNTILKNATSIRNLILSDNKNELELEYDNNSFCKISSTDIAQNYASKFPVPELGQGVIIAFGNRQCAHYNAEVRNNLFPGKANVQIGDLLMVINNNYHSYSSELLNGEMVKVVNVSSQTITRSNIPVFETINTKRIRKHINLSFRYITIQLANSPNEIECLIIDTLLHSTKNNLSLSEMKALYIDFVMRYEEVQKQNENNGLKKHLVGSDHFKEALKEDPFYNAIRVKFGYSITCHKSQGGEWDTIFVDYFGRNSLTNDTLRWSYTATTRAINTCYAANAPHVTTFSSFNIRPIQEFSSLQKNALSLENVILSPFHKEKQHKAKSLKYWEIADKLENTEFTINNVECYGDWLERYEIVYNDEIAYFDGILTGSGVFNDFKISGNNSPSWSNALLSKINEPYTILFTIKYKPSTPFLEILFQILQSFTSSLDINICNIEERVENYFVNYFLHKNGTYYIIQFYFNDNGQLTKAMPKMSKNGNKVNLEELIKKLEDNVI